jgi:zinc transport system substrate-binding protein
MKKITIFLLILLSLIITLAGCGGKTADKDKTGDGKIKIIATIFPQYDWAREIVGGDAGNIDLTLLQSGKADLHNYQPSVEDIVKISECDLFIYVGGESDEWVEEVLKKATNPNMAVINLVEVLGDDAKTEDIVEGMEEEADDGHAEKGGDDDEEELDEHVWLSLRNAQKFCSAIAGALSELDGGNAEKYKNNLSAYTQKLSGLDSRYKEAASASPNKTLLFGDRFPFRYLVDDYGLKYYAAFPGCSAETEASFKTIVFLAKQVDKLGLRSVLVTESADRSIAKTIISNTKSKDQQIIELNSVQSVTQSDALGGITYLSIMESNLEALKQALK